MRKTCLLLMFFFLYLQPAFPRQIWQQDDYSLRLKNKTLEICQASKKMVEISAFAFNFIEPESVSVENSAADSLILKLIFKETDGFAFNFPSEVLLRISRHGDTFHFSARHEAFRHITIKMKDLDEHYFGLIEKLYPHNSKNPDLRGNTVDVDVYAAGANDYAENYASAYSAFYMSSRGYGSFFDTFAKGRYRFAINGVTEIYHQTDALNWYLFIGSSGDRIHAQYFDIIGRPKSVPIWACGPVFWRDQNNGGSSEILADIEKFTEMKIPLTACWVDRPYSDGGHQWSRMNFSELFAQPEKWIRTINEKFGMEFMTWIAPMTFSDDDFPGLLPNFKNYMDLTNPDALAEFERRLIEHQYSVGVKGHKMDRADENFPLTALWREPVPESSTRNKYIYLYAKTIHEFLSRAHGRDQFNFARAAFHRSQPYLSALWGGDNRSNWMGMAASQANAMRIGFQGFPVWGNDTGGYLGAGKIDEELYARWLQWSAWNGLFEIKIDGAGGMGQDRPPWKYPEDFHEIFRRACELRMDLLPYIYSAANTSYKNGVMMKPLAYVFPWDENTYAVWDEYMFGDTFLVAPVFAPGGRRDVYLPEGEWYCFNDPQKSYKGKRVVNLKVPLDEIPVFIRDNSIYITGDIFRGNSRVWKGDSVGDGSLTIHLFPGKSNTGTEFTYVDYTGGDEEKKMVLSRKGNRIVFTSEPLSLQSTLAVQCPREPKTIRLNGKEIEFNYGKSSGIVEIQAGAKTAVKLEIQL
ncbi:MAG: glycoside hydrolase family 31 protein [Acidobacteria bacterium]|nr:glycoside hydrolase family 31 protein [Acidobacteriota bacterium]